MSKPIKHIKTQQPKKILWSPAKPGRASATPSGHSKRHSLEQSSPLTRRRMLREICFLSFHVEIFTCKKAVTSNHKQPKLQPPTTAQPLQSHCKATARARFNVSDKMVWEFRCVVNTLAAAGTANNAGPTEYIRSPLEKKGRSCWIPP